MGKPLLLCDSTCDLSLEMEHKLGIRVINCPIELEGLPYRERTEVTSDRIYESVARTGVLPHHAQVTVIEFLEAYAKAARDGYTDIICVTMNAQGSGTHSAAMHAITLLPTEYPALEGKLNVRVIDSGTYALAMGGPIFHAAEKLAHGASAAEAGDFLQDYFDHQMTLLGLMSLQYAQKSGRLGACEAVVGSILGIKPILSIARDNKVIAKTRGDKSLITKMTDLYFEFAADPKGDYILTWGDNPEDAKELVSAIKKRGGGAPFLSGPIGPCVAVNAGPKMIGMGFRRT
ncbi:MAG: DegV family protein [Oscillospiraceae bacterium]